MEGSIFVNLAQQELGFPSQNQFETWLEAWDYHFYPTEEENPLEVFNHGQLLGCVTNDDGYLIGLVWPYPGHNFR